MPQRAAALAGAWLSVFAPYYEPAHPASPVPLRAAGAALRGARGCH